MVCSFYKGVCAMGNDCDGKKLAVVLLGCSAENWQVLKLHLSEGCDHRLCGKGDDPLPIESIPQLVGDSPVLLILSGDRLLEYKEELEVVVSELSGRIALVIISDDPPELAKVKLAFASLCQHRVAEVRIKSVSTKEWIRRNVPGEFLAGVMSRQKADLDHVKGMAQRLRQDMGVLA
jgi:hypothetical protein